jgi:predicted nucleotidyltransferase
MIYLREKDKKRLIQLFENINKPIEVLAYGSRVNGKAHEGSDLDLVFRQKETDKPDFNLLTELKHKIGESNIPILVDIRDWNMLPQAFHTQIEKHNECLYRNF